MTTEQTSLTQNEPLRILSLDGGSILTLISLYLLRRMVTLENDFLSRVNVIAGTSAGAFNGLVLAQTDLGAASAGQTIDHCIKFWEEDALNLTRNSVIGTVEAWTGLGAVYQTEALFAYYRDHFFGDTRLSQLKKKVAITSFQLDSYHPLDSLKAQDGANGFRSWQPIVYHNFETIHRHDKTQTHPLEDHNPHLKVVDVALASGSPPILSPIYNGHLDGGVFANNPAMAALTLMLRSELLGPETSPGSVLNRSIVLSLGTGRNPLYVQTSQQFTNWGYSQWLIDLKEPLLLIESLFEAAMLAVDYQCRHLLGENRYVRINPELQKTIHRHEPINSQHHSALVERLWETTESISTATLQRYLETLKSAGW
ncbi:MAG TPA: patatin-like phospholipase family protein [Anaerolineae bacterium]